MFKKYESDLGICTDTWMPVIVGFLAICPIINTCVTLSMFKLSIKGIDVVRDEEMYLEKKYGKR